METITKNEKAEYNQKHNQIFEEKAFATRAIHVGQPPEFMYGSVNMPIHLSSTFAQNDLNDPFYFFDYGRCGNPTRDALEKVVASLENAKYALVGSSCTSMAALIVHLMKTGDHMLAVDHVYWGHFKYFKEIAVPTYGMELDWVDMSDLELLKSKIKDNTRLLWLETPTNPLLKIFDIKAIAEICNEYNIIMVVDNTFMSPYFQKPLDLGAHITIHSASKYFGGHSDIIMGMIMTNNEEYYLKLRDLQGSIGVVSSPFDCYLVLRSWKTLTVRMKQIGKNALSVAKFLERHESVEKVNYPMLESHTGHEIHKKQATGGGGVLSFVIKDGTFEKVSDFWRGLKIFTIAKSLGGCDSLVVSPAASLSNVPKEDREKLGIVDGLIRMSVGIEDIDDLISDLNQSLENLNL